MFSNSKIVFYLRRNSLELYFGDQQEMLEFPPSLLNNLEISNLEGYKKLISEFLSKLDLGDQNSLVLLSDEVIFSKIFPIEIKDLDLRVSQFLETVPFESEKLVSKTIKSLKEELILVANQEIYSELISLLESLNWTVKAVVPLHIFKSSLNLISDNIDTQIAKRILGEHDLMEAGNLLQDSDGQVEKSAKTYPLTALLLIGLILILVTSFLMAATFGLIKSPLEYLLNTQNSQPAFSESSQPTEATSSATAEKTSSVSKEGLTTQVLNGSGITGQAAKVKTQLTGLGFTDIETGNATGISTEETIVVFSDKVGQTIQDEVKTELERTYSEVSVEQATVFQFDIAITTGTELVE